LAPFQIYDYDEVDCPAHYGRVRYELETLGQTIGSMDLLIAAHALSLDATLVTNNPAHFERVSGLKVANWLKQA
jgi:tRNA(fMet)-specific endonuclease VapC